MSGAFCGWSPAIKPLLVVSTLQLPAYYYHGIIMKSSIYFLSNNNCPGETQLYEIHIKPCDTYFVCFKIILHISNCVVFYSLRQEMSSVMQ